MSFEKTSLFEGAGSVLGDTKDSRISLYKKYIEENPNSCFEFSIDEEKDEVILKKYIQNDEEYQEIEIPSFATFDGELYSSGNPFEGVTQSLKVKYNNNRDIGKSMVSLFNEYKGKKLDLSEFYTNGIKDMTAMFECCKNLVELDISGFDTSEVESMELMFSCCYRLRELDLSNFDTSEVRDMSDMFSDCCELSSLDLSSFDTSKVTNMDYMFVQCDSLLKLDLRHFNFSSVENFRNFLRHDYNHHPKVNNVD